ncbi:MAG: hypothetical protein KAT05_09170 [Spirochaetes bacterium]|nr:hypothetical protein [Spirochaetota bacterium]
MNKIEFNHTGNIFLNSGIVALDYYLSKYKNDELKDYDYSHTLQETKLTVESETLYNLLEEVYYVMGKDIYNTSGKNAREKYEKYYFKKEPFKAIGFYKMNSYGLSSLITNNATPTAGQEGKKIKFDLLYQDDKAFARKIASFLFKQNKKLKFYSYLPRQINVSKLFEKKENKEIEEYLSVITKYYKKENTENIFILKEENDIEHESLRKLAYWIIKNKIKYDFVFDSFILLKNPIKEKSEKKEIFLEHPGGEAEIFIDTPYTKTTILPDYDEAYFQDGNAQCYLTGRQFKKLVIATSSSPFLSGLNGFESFFDGTKSKKISWIAMYLSRFSPILSLYKYISGLDSLVCYFINSNTLLNIKHYFDISKDFFNNKLQLIEDNYMANFKVYNFNFQNKNDENQYIPSNEYVWESEILFMLIFTIYRRFFFETNNTGNDLLKLINIEIVKCPISLIYLRADKFSGTMRPKVFEEFNNFKFIIQVIAHCENRGIDFGMMLSSLKFLKESDKNSKSSYQLERKLREKMLNKILKISSIILEMEKLFYNVFLYRISGNDKRYRDYKMILNFLSLYESIIKFGGNDAMTDEIKEKAIKLGSSIGIRITNFENDKEDKKKKNENAKHARKYIISLNKARTLQQFLDEIIRIQNKYALVISGDLLASIKEENWEYIKRFALIATLNILNSIYKTNQKNTQEGENNG